jgi:drug/metabolite transporter (DMT)-like permease
VKSIVYAIIGIVLYAIQNVIIDVKLKQYSTISLLLGFYLALLPLAGLLFVYQKYFGDGVVVPSGDALKIVAVVAVMFFIADFFYLGAYTSGGNVVVVTILLVLMPIIGALLKFLWVKEVPTLYHIASFVFATLAVVFIAIGNSKKTVEVETTTPQIVSVNTSQE